MKSPFEILELKPFLFASAKDHALLKSYHLKLSRQYHPDRFANASDEDKKHAEERSSEINRAIREILDPWARVESVLRQLEIPINSNKKAPDLAMEYFQVQEEIDENPAQAGVVKEAFLKKLAAETDQCEKQLEEIAQPFTLAFDGLASAWPPAPQVTQRLLELYQRRNYIKRMQENLAPGPKAGPL